jgi:chemotaxis signal transduction protein
MLLLLFRIKETWCGLDSRQVQEVVPHVPLNACPGMPESVAGFFTYRGGATPVLDLGLLLGTASCARRLSTRIIVVPAREAPGVRRSLGLLAESVTGMMQAREEDFRRGSLALADAPVPGERVADHRRTIRCLRTEALLTAESERRLFALIRRG